MYAAAQAPSEDTMHGPTGSSGVHIFPNSGQPSGGIRPVMTSPQRQAVGVSALFRRISNFRSASNAASSSENSRPLSSISPRPRQEARAGWNARLSISCARALPSALTARLYSFTSPGRPSESILSSS